MTAAEPLTDEQITERLKDLPGWERRGDEITRTFPPATTVEWR